MNNRITSEKITELEDSQIFVFGSNQSGKHTKFAAKQALKWGAKMGQAEGLQGKTYGIPTKNKSVSKELKINEIKPYVDRFIDFAKNNPNLIFLVTKIGCGASGYKPKEIAPLFKEAINVNNIHLPSQFWRKLK